MTLPETATRSHSLSRSLILYGAVVAIGIAGYAQRRRGTGAIRAPASLAQASGNSNKPAAIPEGD